jgi:hypothetical protein
MNSNTTAVDDTIRKHFMQTPGIVKGLKMINKAMTAYITQDPIKHTPKQNKLNSKAINKRSKQIKGKYTGSVLPDCFKLKMVKGNQCVN